MVKGESIEEMVYINLGNFVGRKSKLKSQKSKWEYLVERVAKNTKEESSRNIAECVCHSAPRTVPLTLSLCHTCEKKALNRGLSF